MKYRILFTGRLAEGKSQEEVTAAIAALFKTTPEKVAAKFFTGKPVIINEIADLDKAKKFYKAIMRTGAIVEVKKVGSPEKAAPPPEATPPAPPPHIKKETASSTLGAAPGSASEPPGKKSKLVPAIAGLLIVIAAAAGGGYYWVTTSLLNVTPPDTVVDIENSFAADKLVALVHANVGKGVELQKLLQGIDPDEMMVGPDDTGFAANLARAGVNVKTAIDHMVMAVNLSEDGQSAWMSAVLLGNFPVNKIKKYLGAHYEVTVPEKGNWLLITSVDEETCQQMSVRAVSLSPTRIVVSDPSRIGPFIARLGKSKKASATSLGQWSVYRKGRIASAALFSAKDMGKAADGMAGMMLSGVSKGLGPVKSIYLGAQVTPTKPGVLFDATVNTNDSAWVGQAAKTVQTTMSGVKKDANELTAALLESFAVKVENNRLRISFMADSQFTANINKGVSDLTQNVVASAMGGGIKRAPGQSTGAPPKDVIDDDPVKFPASFPVANLKSFNAYPKDDEQPGWTGGPFAVGLKKVKFTDEGFTELHFESEGRGLGPSPRFDPVASFAITSVMNANGDELLRDEPCGKERNKKPSPFGNSVPWSSQLDGNTVKYQRTTTKKSVRLKKDVMWSQVASMKGKITLNHPEATASQVVTGPLAGKEVELEKNLKIAFDAAGKDTLSATIYGDKSKLLAVRALNNDKKPLKKSGGMWGPAFFGSGFTLSESYQGNVQHAELVLAKKMVEKKWPVAIEKLSLGVSAERLEKPSPEVILQETVYHPRYRSTTHFNLDQGDKAAVFRKGPFNMALIDPQVNSFTGATMQLKVKTKMISALVNNLSGFELAILSATSGNGTKTELAHNEFIPLAIEQAPGKKGKKADSILSAQYRNIRFVYDDKGKGLASLAGAVKIRLPQEFLSITLGDVSPGATEKDENFTLKVVEMTRDGITVSISGDHTRVIRFAAKNANGENLALNMERFEKMENGAHHARLRIEGAAASIDLVYAGRQAVINYPVTFTFMK